MVSLRLQNAPKLQQEYSYKMHKPASPCRKTCSTSHNSENQGAKHFHDKLRRLHHAEFKVMLVP